MLTPTISGVSFYEVVLSEPLQPNEVTSIQLGIAHLNRLIPSPEFGTQQDSQTFVLGESRYALSAYPSTEQNLKIM